MNTAGAQREISDLPFTDLYVRIDDPTVPGRFRPDPLKSQLSGNHTVPPEYAADVEEIRRKLKSSGSTEGTLTYKGKRLRYARFEAAEQEDWAALRAVPLDLPSLVDLKLNHDFVKMARGWFRKKGLIIVGGKTGDGKTTTSIALLRDFLERGGGFLYTCEDPIEYQMQGAITAEAFCLQYEVKDDEDWNPAIKRAMRTRPDYIFIGEIRTPAAAEQLLKAATSGHLCLATIHAGSLADSLAAILQLAENKIGPVARQILADRLIAVIHQTLGREGPSVSCIVPGALGSNSDNIIRSGDLSNLDRAAKSYPPQG